jgi:hypothetical protein
LEANVTVTKQDHWDAVYGNKAVTDVSWYEPQAPLVIATFGPSGPERCSGLPTMRYDESALAAELGSGFRLIESSLSVHRTPWNAAQQFLHCRFARLVT